MKRAASDGEHGKNDLTAGIINSCIKTATTKQFGGVDIMQIMTPLHHDLTLYYKVNLHKLLHLYL